MPRFSLAIAALVLCFSSRPAVADGPKDCTLLIIRHAEKSDSSPGLSARGRDRAKAYIRYFRSFAVDSKPVKIDAIFATADSGESQRCRLTVEPFAKAANLPVNVRFSHKQVQALVEELRAKCDGKNTLVCWHHGEMPELLTALGADPAVLLPGGDWPNAVFDWLLVLAFDHEGRLIPAQSKRLYEHLLPRDP